MIRFLTFSQFHNKVPVAGSTHIRVNQLIKYWEEADLYKYGENPDVLIFQKVYVLPDYQFPKTFKGIKILDMCDSDWMNGLSQVKETIDSMDAVTTSSVELRKFVSQMTDKPVVHIPDRFDLEVIPKPKVHKGKAKSVVWFGYSHNADLLKPAIKVIEELGLKLIVISDHDPFAWRWGTKLKDGYTYIKYDEETIYHDLQRADYALLPEGNRPVDRFKSNNKTIKALLCGLPVAKDREGMERFSGANARNLIYKGDKDILSLYEEYRKEYDVRKSVEQYKELIGRLK